MGGRWVAASEDGRWFVKKLPAIESGRIWEVYESGDDGWVYQRGVVPDAPDMNGAMALAQWKEEAERETGRSREVAG